MSLRPLSQYIHDISKNNFRLVLCFDYLQGAFKLELMVRCQFTLCCDFCVRQWSTCLVIRYQHEVFQSSSSYKNLILKRVLDFVAGQSKLPSASGKQSILWGFNIQNKPTKVISKTVRSFVAQFCLCLGRTECSLVTARECSARILSSS